MTKIKKPLLLFVQIQLAALMLLFISETVYLNFVIAMVSSSVIVIGSLYSYRKMIQQRVLDVDIEDQKDIIDMMDDPYDLYEEERSEEIGDIKALIKEEKARQRADMAKNTVQNASAWVSAYRLIPYAILVLGFIALQNNNALMVLPYLVGLAAGIGSGYWMGKELFIEKAER